jgi:para-aminobenzoate synthetase/4-amino-4-deoxychorismate lyase
VLEKSGEFAINFLPITESGGRQSRPLIALYDKECVDSKNVLLRHKTTNSTVRKFYDETMLRYGKKFYEVIFLNEEGYITEGSKCNIFIKNNNRILTPAGNCGLLAGVMRNNILRRNPLIEESCLRPEDLYQADAIWLTNSVRGMQEVSLCKKKS